MQNIVLLFKLKLKVIITFGLLVTKSKHCP